MDEEPRAGWRIDAWCKEVGISRNQIYRLMRAGDLKTAKVGASRIILEAPQKFLERHAEA